MKPDVFWNFNLGNVVSIFAVLIPLAIMHKTNVKTMQDMQTKVDLMYKWFERNVINASIRSHPRPGKTEE